MHDSTTSIPPESAPSTSPAPLSNAPHPLTTLPPYPITTVPPRSAKKKRDLKLAAMPPGGRPRHPEHIIPVYGERLTGVDGALGDVDARESLEGGQSADHPDLVLEQIISSIRGLLFCSTVNQFFVELLNEFARHTRAAGGSIYWVGERGLRLVHALDPGHAPGFIPFPLKEGSILRWVFEHNVPVLVSDKHQVNAFIDSGWQGYKDDSALIFPIHQKDGAVVALVSLHSKLEPPFNERDRAFGVLLASFGCEALRAVRVTAELRRSVHKYRLLAENLKDVVLAMTPDGYITYCSPAITKFGGYVADLEMGQHIRRYFAERDDLQVCRELIDEMSDSIQPTSMEFSFKASHGGTFPAEMTLKPVCEQETVVAFQCVLRDVTERRRAEAIYRRQSAALEQSFDGIAILDLDGRFLSINPAWAEMHGVDAAELMGRHVGVCHTEQQMTDQVVPLMRRVMLHGAYACEVGHRRADGSIFQTRLSASILRDDRDQPIGIVKIIHDATERLALEEQLREAAKFESLGQITGGIAHDFNNMLSPIIGYSELILMELPADSAVHGDVEQIKAAAESARDLTRQLLAFSRKQVLAFKTVCLGDIVLRFEGILRRAVPESVAVSYSYNQTGGHVRGDVSQIEQILMNLVVNAKDAMPCGGEIEVDVEDVALTQGQIERLRLKMAPGNYVVLRVRDAGCGMSAETQERIFEPFYTTKEVGKGTGLGMATVYGIVKQHNAEIGVQSELGIGTCISVYFPRISAAKSDAALARDELRSRTGSETVMVVEDNERVRRLFYTILSNFGYHVIAAQDAQEAIELFEENRDSVRLLITDMIMPKMNGKALFDQLVTSSPALKVIYVSGYTADVITSQGISDEGRCFLQKPVTIAELTDRVRAVLDEG